jgi:hypothetical protein
MRLVDRLEAVIMVALGAVALSACAAPSAPPTETAATLSGTAPRIMIAPDPPPPNRAEIQPPAPSPQAMWHSGNWRWNGAKYVWVAGHYVERPSPTANWTPGYWEQRPEGWIWVEGRWNS